MVESGGVLSYCRSIYRRARAVAECVPEFRMLRK
jgi:hypothetical protein